MVSNSNSALALSKWTPNTLLFVFLTFVGFCLPEMEST